MMLPMTWLWIILRCLFPGDPIRQTAEAMRHRVIQLVDTVSDGNWLPQLQADPAFRLYLEFLILDAEDCLRLWISRRGCQIARIRRRTPWVRCDPHLVHAKDLPELIARIRALAATCEHMEDLAQAHAAKLTRLRDADPLAAHGSPDAMNGAARCAAAHHELVDVSHKSNKALILSSTRSVRPSKDERVLTALATTKAQPHSIAATHPQPASQASPARTRTRAQSAARRQPPAVRRPARACPGALRTPRASRAPHASRARHARDTRVTYLDRPGRPRKSNCPRPIGWRLMNQSPSALPPAAVHRRTAAEA